MITVSNVDNPSRLDRRLVVVYSWGLAFSEDSPLVLFSELLNCLAGDLVFLSIVFDYSL